MIAIRVDLGLRFRTIGGRGGGMIGRITIAECRRGSRTDICTIDTSNTAAMASGGGGDHDSERIMTLSADNIRTEMIPKVPD